MIVRISRANFEPERAADIELRMRRASDSLSPALRRLTGLVSFYAAVDAASGTMVNVSLWQTLDYARQLDSLAEMQALATEFVAAGARFERPIINYDSMWTV